MRHEASFAMARIRNAILEDDMHNAAIYLQQAITFTQSALAFAQQASMENMVERPLAAVQRPKPKLTLVHSKD